MAEAFLEGLLEFLALLVQSLKPTSFRGLLRLLVALALCVVGVLLVRACLG